MYFYDIILLNSLIVFVLRNFKLSNNFMSDIQENCILLRRSNVVIIIIIIIIYFGKSSRIQQKD